MQAMAMVALLVSCSLLAESTPVTLRRTTVEGLVQRLRDGGFRVHFERRLSEPEEAVALKKQIGILEAIPSAERTPEEERDLRSLQELRKTGKVPDESTANWKQTQFGFDYRNEIGSVSSVLDAILSHDPEYCWKRISASYVVFPRQESLNREIGTTSLRDQDRDTTFEVIRNKVLSPCELALEWGPDVGPPHPGLWDTLAGQRFSLTSEGEDAHTVLTRFAQLIGPDVVWTSLGSKRFRPERSLGLSKIRVRGR